MVYVVALPHCPQFHTPSLGMVAWRCDSIHEPSLAGSPSRMSISTASMDISTKNHKTSVLSQKIPKIQAMDPAHGQLRGSCDFGKGPQLRGAQLPRAAAVQRSKGRGDQRATAEIGLTGWVSHKAKDLLQIWFKYGQIMVKSWAKARTFKDFVILCWVSTF